MVNSLKPHRKEFIEKVDANNHTSTGEKRSQLFKALAWLLLAIAVLAVINYRYLDNLYKLRTMTPVSIPLLILVDPMESR